MTDGSRPAQKPRSLTQRRSSAAAALRILRREQRDAFQARRLADETIVKPVVVALRDRRGPRRQLNHADGQRGGGIEHGAVDAVFILKADPRLGVWIFALALARQAALPAVGIEHGPGRVPVHFAEITLDMREKILVIFHDMAVGVDDEFCHGLLLKVQMGSGFYL